MVREAVLLDDESAHFGDMRSPPEELERRRLLSLWRFLETDRYLVRRKQAFVGTVQRKLHTGSYQRKLAPKLWAFWVDEGIRRYFRMHPRTDPNAFAGRLRMKLAREIATYEHQQITRGRYPDLTVDGTERGDRMLVARWQGRQLRP
jgi:hypothetical protein